MNRTFGWIAQQLKACYKKCALSRQQYVTQTKIRFWSILTVNLRTPFLIGCLHWVSTCSGCCFRIWCTKLNWVFGEHFSSTFFGCFNQLMKALPWNWIVGKTTLIMYLHAVVWCRTKISRITIFWQGYNSTFFKQFFWNEKNDSSRFWESPAGACQLPLQQSLITYHLFSALSSLSMDFCQNPITNQSWSCCLLWRIGMGWQKCASTTTEPLKLWML